MDRVTGGKGGAGLGGGDWNGIKEDKSWVMLLIFNIHTHTHTHTYTYTHKHLI